MEIIFYFHIYNREAFLTLSNYTYDLSLNGLNTSLVVLVILQLQKVLVFLGISRKRLIMMNS